MEKRFQALKVPKKVVKFAFVASYAILFTIFVTPSIFTKEPNSFRVVYFDVGQGDSTLIQTTDGKTILVDGGPGKNVIYKLGKYLPWWKKKIDIMVLTHPHADHLIGLLEIMERYQVGKILHTGVPYNSPEYSVFLKRLDEKGYPFERITKRKQIFIDSQTAMEFIYPDRDLEEERFENVNNASIVMRLTYGEAFFLFTGDLEKDAQEGILDLTLRSDVLKVPHQGSSDSLHPEFLKKVTPFISVISVGENKYGHPSKRVIRALERMGSEVYITQDYGDIRIFSDGKEIAVR